MAFPDIPTTDIVQKLAQAFDSLGHTATVTLRGASTPFANTIKVSTGFRNDQNLTEGLAQQTERVKILCSQWDAESPGRPPEKGDQVVFLGRRTRIQGKPRVRGLGDASFMYVCEILG